MHARRRTNAYLDNGVDGARLCVWHGSLKERIMQVGIKLLSKRIEPLHTILLKCLPCTPEGSVSMAWYRTY